MIRLSLKNGKLSSATLLVSYELVEPRHCGIFLKLRLMFPKCLNTSAVNDREIQISYASAVWMSSFLFHTWCRSTLSVCLYWHAISVLHSSLPEVLISSCSDLVRVLISSFSYIKEVGCHALRTSYHVHINVYIRGRKCCSNFYHLPV